MVEFAYDVELKVPQKRTTYDGEKNLIHEFNASKHKNVSLRYPTAIKAKNAAQALVTYVKQTHTPVRITQRNNKVIIFRKGDE